MLELILQYLLSQTSGEENPDLGAEDIQLAEKALEFSGYRKGGSSQHQELLSVFSGLFKDSPTGASSFGFDRDFAQAVREILSESEKTESSKTFRSAERLLSETYRKLNGFGSAGNSHPDLSAYSLVKTAAAIAETLKRDRDAENFVIIGADLSGLQSYLYGIVSKYAAKNLKGRSFYLQLVIEDVLLEMARELNLMPWQVLYSSGGGFYVLAGAEQREAIKEFLHKLSAKRNKAFFEAHGAALYLALASVEVPYAAQNEGNIGNHWKELSEALGKAKAARYRSSLLSEFDSFFSVDNTKQQYDVDHITGREVKDRSKKQKLKSGDGEAQVISSVTQQQIDLGKDLKKSDLWVVKTGGDGYTVPGSPFSHHFLKGSDAKSLDLTEVFALRNFVPDELGIGAYYGYGGNRYPTLDTDREKEIHPTFDRIAKSREGEIERLGVLRMDVDNLGSAFIKGFSKRNYSLGLYAELSMRLVDFFTTRVNKLIDSDEHFRQNIFVIYSGGDDLFAIGQWSTLLTFAEELKNSFSEYMGGEFLTLSAGFSMVTPKYPVLKAGELAGDAEERAKSFKRNGKVKDAIDLFGLQVGWEEFGAVKGYRDNWLDWFEGKMDGINSGLLNKLQVYRKIKTEHPESLKWQWNAAYNIARRETKNNKEEIAKIKAVIIKGENNYRALDLCCIGGRWADFLNRNKIESNEI